MPLLDQNEAKMLDEHGAVNFEVKLGSTIKAISDYLRNCIQAGFLVTAPTNASTHGDAGAYDFQCNMAAGVLVVDGVIAENEAVVNYDLSHGDTSPIGATNTDIIYTIYAKNVNGTITIHNLAGAAAPAGSVKAPTDAEITAVAGTKWIRIANVQVHRSAADACTLTYNNKVRPTLVD